MQSAQKQNSPQPNPSRSDLINRRKKKATWLVVSLLLLSFLIITLGIFATTRTESVSVTGYGSGIIFAFGSFLGILGLFLEENRKQLLIAAIVFLSLGIIASFFCLVVDGVFIVLNIDLRPLRAGRCQYYTSGHSYLYENYFASVPCQGLTESCSLKVRSGTCYCCDLYDCANGGYLNNHYEYVGVRSCQEVLSLYVMIWLLTALNLSAFFLGILATAVLGSIKDVKGSAVSPELNTQLLAPTNYRHSYIQHKELNGALSPTAPLLQQDPGASSLYLNPSVHFTPPALSELTPASHPDTRNPPPFAPLYNLLPHKTAAGYSV
ncbi:transmembrane protein 255B-like isoform X1 [Acipenser ruthenus]|uniref:transmembrane protein 255B-like isoform X1 n=1 Tax=Acipenser ruthenus TaxID=7906 RepID=UPI00145AF02D|nr:transmembrane protein 255B-like isoform X1 [Acipenser ruthenus]